MKKFRVVFIKVQKILANQNQPVMFLEQTYLTGNKDVQINVPEGFAVFSVTELLPDVTQPLLTSLKN